jgi:putative membrane protein
MRPMFAIGGWGMLAVAWLGPLPGMATHSFAAHMTLHMVVVAIAAPLIAIGLAGGAWDPVPKAPRWFAPIPISVLELIVVWGWHAPGLHHWARHHPAGLALEQSMFFGVGLLLWISAFGGRTAGGHGSRLGAGIAGLLLTSMHMTLLGALLALTPRPLYGHAAPVGGWSPLADQHLGGAIMLVIGGLSYLAGGLALTVQLLRTAPMIRRTRPSCVARNAPAPDAAGSSRETAS